MLLIFNNTCWRKIVSDSDQSNSERYYAYMLRRFKEVMKEERESEADK